jgi:hypothetical protein
VPSLLEEELVYVTWNVALVAGGVFWPLRYFSSYPPAVFGSLAR